MMLLFKQAVQNPDGSATIFVFTDEDKGHTVYLSQSGQMFVVEAEKRSSQKVRAAGFMAGGSSCSDCDGC